MGSSRQTTRETRDPWAPAQPALREAVSGAMDAYNNTFQGTGVAEIDPLLAEGRNTMETNARSGALSSLGNQAVSNMSGVMGNGGLSAFQSGAASGIGGALGDFNSTMRQTMGSLNPYASGQNLTQRNPYLDRAVGDSMQRASEAANRQFSASGRYGSGAHSGVLADRLGSIANTAYMQDYNQQQQNQLQALGMMGNLANAGLSGNMQGQNMLAGLGQQGITNTAQISAGLPILQAGQNIDAQTLAGLGGQNMDYQQTLIDAANNNPWQRVGNLADIATAVGGMGGTGTRTTTQNSGIAGTIGGVMAGIGGINNLARGISSLPSSLSSIGSSLAALPAIFSDKRLKNDFGRIGRTDDGQPIHAYQYKWGGPVQIGLMAQEVAKRKPEAVMRDPDSGYLMVDYAKATGAA